MADPPVAFEADDFIALGFEIRGFKKHISMSDENRQAKFRCLFGTSASVIALIWADLSAEGLINNSCKPAHMLLTYRWLKSYESEEELETEFGFCVNTIKKWCKLLTTQIASLRKTKIDPNWFDDDGLKLCRTVDGVHCPIEEPRPFTTQSSSYKHGGDAGVSYEVALLTHKPKIAWINGPFRAGKQDKTIFKHHGLKEAVEELKKLRSEPDIRVIADDGYFAAANLKTLSLRNEFDPRELAYYKDRALARQERINGRAKDFKFLKTKFRHDRGWNVDGLFPRHQACTVTVFVTLQYELDLGEMTLFDPYPT